VLDGGYRTRYPSGRLHEVKHYANGREEGLQQAWTEDGTLYLNYEMRNGRRYGFVNARPCRPVQTRGVR
jgi:antitoxin component YwqK of YwqJK toxin-antitoxin module